MRVFMHQSIIYMVIKSGGSFICASFLNSLTLLQIGMDMGDLGARAFPRCDEGRCLEPGAAQVMHFGVNGDIPFEFYGCGGADMKKFVVGS